MYIDNYSRFCILLDHTIIALFTVRYIIKNLKNKYTTQIFDATQDIQTMIV